MSLTLTMTADIEVTTNWIMTRLLNPNNQPAGIDKILSTVHWNGGGQVLRRCRRQIVLWTQQQISFVEAYVGEQWVEGGIIQRTER